MKFFFIAGLISTLTSYTLASLAAVGLCLTPVPVWLSRAIVVLAITLLAASTVIAVAYIAELLIAYIGANAYERAAFTVRITGVLAWVYWLAVGSSLAPQLFWVRRFRSRPLPALLISLAAILPSAIERAYAATR